LSRGEACAGKHRNGDGACANEVIHDCLLWVEGLRAATLSRRDIANHVGHPVRLKVFATPEAADDWFKENDPEGVVFGYEVIE
jgi:hypothetical protein